MGGAAAASSAAPTRASTSTAPPTRDATAALLGELLFQAPARGSWVLDGGAKGLVEELRTIGAGDASREVIPGRGTIAGHARHVRFFLGLFNAWTRGEDPWGTADWADAWAHQQVCDADWRALLDELAGGWSRLWGGAAPGFRWATLSASPARVACSTSSPAGAGARRNPGGTR
ncbi:MAG: hypothetical protein ACYC3Q_15550 [Gemmatimonadaceae bacterium]